MIKTTHRHKNKHKKPDRTNNNNDTDSNNITDGAEMNRPVTAIGARRV